MIEQLGPAGSNEPGQPLGLELGPRSYVDTFAELDSVCKKVQLLNDHGRAHDYDKVIVGSDFAGAGTAEIAMMIAKLKWDNACEGEGRKFPAVQIWRAMDSDPVCRYTLLNHPKAVGGTSLLSSSTSRAEHVFESVDSALSPEALMQMQEYITQAEQQSQIGPRTDLAGKQCRGSRLLQQLWKAAGELKMPTHLQCKRCKQACPIHPPDDVRGSNTLYVVVAGTPCTSWSYMGKRSGWVSDLTISFVLWLRCMMEGKPHVIVHENVEPFDIKSVETLVAEEGYRVESVVWSPQLMGLPAQRNRRYSLFIRNTVDMEVPLTRCTLQAVAGKQ
eukprot:6490276-Amphidinium_carterae.1